MSINQKITSSDFAFFSQLVWKHAGIVLTADKEYLLQSRLRTALPSLGLQSIAELMQALRDSPNTHLMNKIYEAITINETSFFRDQPVYDALRSTILPELIAKSTARPLRVWSAAASTGQEAYSVALLLKDLGAPAVDIQGTDLSQRAIERARSGIYSEFEIQRGVLDSTLTRFFTRQPDGTWKIIEEVRQWVQFRQMNLIQPVFHMGGFDLILCRNVLIYFDDATKAHVLTQLAGCLNAGGYLVLGGTESLVNTPAPLQPLKNMPAFYTKA